MTDQRSYPGSAEPIVFWYKNYRGEAGYRRAAPISIRFGTSEWHKEPQWLLLAFDTDKLAARDFAVRDISAVVGFPTISFAAPAQSRTNPVTDDMVREACEVYGEVYADNDHDMGDAMRAALETALAAQPSPAADSGWQPIETAPKDGTRFWAFQASKDAEQFICWWKQDFAHWEGWQTVWDDEPEPTHWRPLLAVPSPVSSTQRGGEA